jgi:hypothetical protein
MGFWKAEFDKKMAKAIETYAGIYACLPKDLQIKMFLDEHGKSAFCTCIKREVREKVSFLHLYQKPTALVDLTGRSFLIPKLITSSLRRLSGKFRIDPNLINVMAVYDKGEDGGRAQIYLFLMDGVRKVSLLEEDEIMSDEQVAQDAMEEVNQNQAK